MKAKFTLLALSLAFCLQSLAQKASEKAIDKSMTEWCTCFASHLNRLHPRYTQMLETMAAKDESTAQAELASWLETAPEKEKQSFMTSVAWAVDPLPSRLDDCAKRAQ